MWCRSCQQDVPAIGFADESPARCARCQEPFTNDAAPKPEGDSQTESEASAELDSHSVWLEKTLQEDWEFEDELNDAEQLVASIGAGQRAEPVIRFDNSHSPIDTGRSKTKRPNKETTKRHKPARTSLFSWTMLSFGLMAFVFGAVLIGWSFVENRPDLWRLGMPFTLGGQAALIVGLVFQLDGLWRSNRESTETLNEIDSQIDELRRATSLLTTTHSSPAQSFYSHMADGASPNLLLADLKGQLDLLAQRMADDR
jgi:hypothetical protein